ncbi:MAG TPA: C40 family peptidase [Prolixibacteraceae bacterium]|jgi:hypothetical protein
MLKTAMIFILTAMCTNGFADNNDTKTVQRMIDVVSQKYAPDKRTALFDVSYTENSEHLILKGKTNLPEAKRALLDSLSMLKINYTDSVIVIPEKSIGEKTWALVTLSVANIRSGPDHAKELVSQALMGTPVKVLEVVDGWVHIQTPDQYIGWVDESGIALKTEAEMALWKHSKRFFFKQISGRAVASTKRKASSVSDLVLGDLFESISVVKKYLQVKFPDGRTAYVKEADCIDYEDWIAQKPNVDAVLSFAKQMLGNPYMWGGTSCKAVDCSGMTKIAWYTQGVILARDASQQARYGKHIDFNNITNLEKGDLLFFGKSVQHIIHVGMYLGNGLYIHASGLVRINSIDPNDPLYNITERKKLVAATRIVNQVGNEGIIRVKDHGWY